MRKKRPTHRPPLYSTLVGKEIFTTCTVGNGARKVVVGRRREARGLERRYAASAVPNVGNRADSTLLARVPARHGTIEIALAEDAAVVRVLQRRRVRVRPVFVRRCQDERIDISPIVHGQIIVGILTHCVYGLSSPKGRRRKSPHRRNDRLSRRRRRDGRGAADRRRVAGVGHEHCRGRGYDRETDAGRRRCSRSHKHSCCSLSDKIERDELHSLVTLDVGRDRRNGAA